MQLVINWFTGMVAGLVVGVIIAPPGPGIGRGLESMIVIPSCVAAGALIGGVINWL